MKVGFIGCGNMGQAILSGLLESGIVSAKDVIVSAKSDATKEKIKNDYHVKIAENNLEVVTSSIYVFLAVKPQYYAQILQEIAPAITAHNVLVSMAPGKSCQWILEMVGKDCKIVRTMPNTPSMVKEGMMGICANERVTKEELCELSLMCNGFSRTEIVEEGLMDVVTAVSGSSPAYVFMFIEAMADAAVEGGMPRDKAYVFAAQAVMGSAKMVLETKRHPAELKDMVCSPGGTTIQAVRTLEEKGFRAAVMDAMKECLDKSRKM